MYFFTFEQAVIEAGLIAPLVNLLQTAEFDIKKEAAWAISNATSGGTHEQIKYVTSLLGNHPSDIADNITELGVFLCFWLQVLGESGLHKASM